MGVNCLIIRLLQPSIYGIDYHNEGSTTIPKGGTSQANGDGNALPTNNSSEDIV